METKDAILTRRSVRKFTDKHVSDDEIKILLEAAQWAPSWSNTQVWEFVIIKEKAIIEQIAATYSEKNPATKCSMSASVLIAACAKKGISGAYNGKDVTKFSTWYMFDVALACQNICLRAHDIGLGTVIVSLFDHDKCAKILSIPDGYEVLSIIPVGEPLFQKKEGPPRKELSAFTHLNKFNQAYITVPEE